MNVSGVAPVPGLMSATDLFRICRGDIHAVHGSTRSTWKNIHGRSRQAVERRRSRCRDSVEPDQPGFRVACWFASSLEAGADVCCAFFGGELWQLCRLQKFSLMSGLDPSRKILSDRRIAHTADIHWPTNACSGVDYNHVDQEGDKNNSNDITDVHGSSPCLVCIK